MPNFTDNVGTAIQNFFQFPNAMNKNIRFQERSKRLYAENSNEDSDGLESMGIGIEGYEKGKPYRQEAILGIASGQVGKNEWTEYVNRGIYKFGVPKCNIFVYEVLIAAGAKVPRIGGEFGKMTEGRYGYPPLASDWEDKEKAIDGWSVVTKPSPGDVVASTSHVGIYVSQNRIISSNPIFGVREAYFSMENVTFRRYTGAASPVEEIDERIVRRQWH